MCEKIDLVINSLRGGGAERVLVTLANEFILKGYEVRVTVLNLDNAIFSKDLDSRVEIKSLNVKHTKGSLIPLINHFKSYDSNKLIVFNHQLVVMLLIVRRLLRQNFAIIARNINNLSQKRQNERTFWNKNIVFWLTKYFYKKSDHIICQSFGMAEDLMKNFSVSRDKITIINNPVSKIFIERHKDVDLVKPPESIELNKRFLFVGKLTVQKGLEYLLESFKNLVEEVDTDVYLTIVGDGPLKVYIVEYIEKNNLGKYVQLKGFSNDIRQEYLNNDITVLSSVYEGFPNVLLESIASGTPVVAFDCPSGPREIIQHDINGYLVEHLNVFKLTSFLKKAMIKKWNSNKIKETSLIFHPSAVADKYIKVLKKIN